MNLTGKTCGPQDYAPDCACSVCRWWAGVPHRLRVYTKGDPRRVTRSGYLAPLRRLASEPLPPAAPTTKGWPKGFDGAELLGPFNSSRALYAKGER